MDDALAFVTLLPGVFLVAILLWSMWTGKPF